MKDDVPRYATFALMLALAAGVAVAAPIAGQDPRTGEVVSVEANSPATHLVFFATWCPPCVDELYDLTRFSARWEERGYRLILVAVSSRQSAKRLTGFLDDNDVPGRLLFDADGSLQKRFRAEDLPTHIVLDASGKEVHRDDAHGEAVEAALTELLSQGGSGRRR